LQDDFPHHWAEIYERVVHVFTAFTVLAIFEPQVHSSIDGVEDFCEELFVIHAAGSNGDAVVGKAVDEEIYPLYEEAALGENDFIAFVVSLCPV
jgi:hypothetical protein